MAVLTGQSICCRVGLALLKTSEETLVALPFERLLTALNSRQFPAFSRPPAQLLRLALSFWVSRRLSASLAEYQKQQALEEAQQAEQLALKQKQQQAKEAGQTGSGAAAQNASSGQADGGQRSGAQLKENRDTDRLTPPSESARQPDDPLAREQEALQNGDHARHSPTAQQQGAASQHAAAGGAPISAAASELTGAGAEQAPSTSSRPAHGAHNQLAEGVQRGVKSLHGAGDGVGEHPGASDELLSSNADALHANGLAQHLQGEEGAAAYAAGASTGLAEHAEPAGLDDRADSFSSAHSEMAQPLNGPDVDRADVDQAAALDAGASHPVGYYSEAAGQRSDQPSLLPSAAGSSAVARQHSGRQGAMQNGNGSAAVSSKGQATQSGSRLSFFGGASRKDRLGGSPQ